MQRARVRGGSTALVDESARARSHCARTSSESQHGESPTDSPIAPDAFAVKEGVAGPLVPADMRDPRDPDSRLSVAELAPLDDVAAAQLAHEGEVEGLAEVAAAAVARRVGADEDVGAGRGGRGGGGGRGRGRGRGDGEGGSGREGHELRLEGVEG